ncbi:heme-binding domain-containing protein [Niabella drilacis]|uniref:Haem-binding domain-containing protein n=1 Tax=Niabella drilacis (strain DSM 25811 / CCM 8410 / CCUG 62505 / LMG 26954 / E90) TaxID=1285928 RepID=A0A1G6RBJ6_NIADE|nr:heme-binding domain-containing protein [Niabella drilacis]SDD01455.1 Haem-binding domain-containing protein [Niabella drilacis]
MKKKSILKKIVIALLLLLVVIQFFGTDKNSTAVVSENAIDKHYTVPPHIQALLKTSCYDCHSNNTTYPWYSNVQPVKWWLASHISSGKKHLNFDEFNTYPAKKKLHKLDEVAETVGKGEMPLTSYTLIHRNAILSDADRKELEAWAKEVKQQIR